VILNPINQLEDGLIAIASDNITIITDWLRFLFEISTDDNCLVIQNNNSTLAMPQTVKDQWRYDHNSHLQKMRLSVSHYPSLMGDRLILVSHFLIQSGYEFYRAVRK
jgi:hypothetical protein